MIACFTGIFDELSYMMLQFISFNCYYQVSNVNAVRFVNCRAIQKEKDCRHSRRPLTKKIHYLTVLLPLKCWVKPENCYGTIQYAPCLVIETEISANRAVYESSP